MLKKGEAVFRHAGPLLCFKWNEKRDVRMLSTIHKACMVETGKNDALGNKIVKQESVYYYCKKNWAGSILMTSFLHIIPFCEKVPNGHVS